MTISLPNEDKFFVSKSEMLSGCSPWRPCGEAGHGHFERSIERHTTGNRDRQDGHPLRHERRAWPDSVRVRTRRSFPGRDLASTRNYSENVASKIDSEIKRIIDNAYERCKEILTREIDKLHAVAGYLLEHETMDSDTFERFFATGSFSGYDEFEEYTLPNF